MIDVKQQRKINIQKLIRKSGNQVKFAAKVGTSTSYVAQILSEKTRGDCGDKFARQIESGFALPEGWLDEDHDEKNVRMLPFFSASDVVMLADDKKPQEVVYVSTDRVMSERAFAMKIEGDDMQPKIPAGAVILVDPSVDQVPGCIVVLVSSGRVFVREITASADGRTMLKPANERYPLEVFTNDMVFVGRVVESVVRTSFD